MIQRKHVAAAAIVAICCGAGIGTYKGIGGYEGLQTIAYQDASPDRIWTYCYGETKGVKKGDTATPDQCRALLAKRVAGDFVPGVERCITREMPVKVEAAFVSAAYNIGVDAFCRSSMARKWNAGDRQGACDALLLYVHSGDKVLPGLVTRREQERDLCLSG